MIYKSKIHSINADEYEGFLLIEINNIKMLTYYQAPLDFMKKKITLFNEMYIDIWLLDGYGQKVDKKDLSFYTMPQKVEGNILGKVISVFTENEYRLDCGPLLMDVEDEENINLKRNEYIYIEGIFQIYFPNSDFDR